MKFVLWKKGSRFQVYVKGAGGNDDPVIRIQSKKLVIDKCGPETMDRIASSLHHGGVDPSNSYSTPALIAAFTSSNLDVALSGDLKTTTSNAPSSRNYSHESVYDKVDVRQPAELYEQSMFLDINSAPFIRSTSHLHVTVDTREPKEVYDLIKQGKIEDVEYKALEIGDIMISDTKTGDTLLIERKTVSDLYNSTVSKHLHSQAERLYEYTQTLRNAGVRCRVIWLVEGEVNGARMLYNAFPEVKQTDGLVNYLTGILGQHVLCTYGMNHLAYLVLRLAQGFHEQQLKYGISTAKTRKERMAEVSDSAVSGTHGVKLPQRGQADLLSIIPGINARVASTLYESKVTIAKLCLMEIEELCKIDGLGPKSAEKIYNALHSVS